MLRLPFWRKRKKTATEKSVSTRTARRGSWLTAAAATSWMARVMAMRCAISTSSVINVSIVFVLSGLSDLSGLGFPFVVLSSLCFQQPLSSTICFMRASTLGMTDRSTATANTMSISSSSRHPESSAASRISTAMEKETENATSLPSALSANAADMQVVRLLVESGDRTQCAYSATFINRQRHYDRRVELALATTTVHMMLRGLFVTPGSFHKRRVHRGGGRGHLVYGMILGDLIEASSMFGIAPRRIQSDCFRSIRQMRAKLHPSAPLRNSCQAFRLVVGQRDALLAAHLSHVRKGDASCKRGVGACAACFLWMVLLRRHVPTMLSSELVVVICNEFYKNVRIASESASFECSEWRAAIDLEKDALARVCDNLADSIGFETVDEAIDGFQRNVWGVVGLDRVDASQQVGDTEITEETDSLESFECSL